MRDKITAARQAIWNNRLNIACVTIPLTFMGLYTVSCYYDLQTARTQLETAHVENPPIREI